MDVNEGEIIARVGKSGTDSAHLHFAIFKVDPATVGGIDNIANNLTELNNVWEDPLAFIKQWLTTPAPVPVPPPVTDQTQYDFGQDFGVMELQAARSKMQEQKGIVNSLNSKIIQIKGILG
jgi:hypothetical protein